MATSLNNLFNFGRDLPVPFDAYNSNKKISVSSKFGDGTSATLNCSVVKALLAICGQISGSTLGAVGTLDHRSVAEYKSSNSQYEYHLVVYDPTTGSVMASVYNADTELIETYQAGAKGRDCAAIITAMYPFLNNEDEFREIFSYFYDEFSKGFPDVDKAASMAAVLCDNVYRRVKDTGISEHLEVDIDRSGNILRVSQTHIDSGTFTPENVLCGEFSIFDKSGTTGTYVPNVIAHADFVGRYKTSERILSAAENALVPELPDWYVIPAEVVKICRHIKDTTALPNRMRNFLLRGPAGTGKTMDAKAIAAGVGLPYVKYTCSANSEIFDFIGTILPDTAKYSSEETQTQALSFQSIRSKLNLPDVDDLDYDPAGVYEKLTGIRNEDASVQDCILKMFEVLTSQVSRMASGAKSSDEKAPSYVYEETDFIKAIKNGYVVEIQEPTTIMQPGVLVGLNSLLEQTGSITLPTGEVINRHPDTIVVVTTNVSYEGCRGLNQSITDRMNLVLDVEMPTPEVMTERAIAVTGATDEFQVSQMVKVVVSMDEYCKEKRISDGNIGMRGLIDWINSTAITDDPYESALDTIVSKATSDEKDRSSLIASCLATIFPPKRHKA